MKRILFSILILGSTLAACQTAEKKKVELPQTPLLKYEVRMPKVQTEKPPMLILLHGYGSNEKDLFSFADYLDDRLLIISARAPLSMGQDRHKWYTIDLSTKPYPINFSEAEDSRKLLTQFIEQMVDKYGVDEEQVIVGGFSQGAIMSFSLAMTAPEKLKGIVALSGRMLEEVKPLMVEKEKISPVKIFISHGKNDQVLTHDYALQSKAFFENLGCEVEFKSYNTAHTISQENFNDFRSWLTKIVNQ